MHNLIRAGCLSLLTVILGIAGCTAPPDVSPFADATSALRSGVRQAGTAVEDGLRGLAESDANAANKKKIADQADRLATAWDARNKVMDALVRYADGLKAIVDAGNRGAETARAVAAGVKDIAAAAGVAVPGAGAASVVTDAAALIYANIARAEAAKSLEESLTAVQPAIDRLAVLFTTDLKDIDDVIRITGGETENRIMTAHGSHVAFRAKLFAERDRIRKASAVPTGTDADRLKQLDEMVAATDAEEGALSAEQQRERDKVAAQRALVRSARAALQEWAAAHDALVRALKEHQPVSVESLVEFTTELRSLVRKVREL